MVTNLHASRSPGGARGSLVTLVSRIGLGSTSLFGGIREQPILGESDVVNLSLRCNALCIGVAATLSQRRPLKVVELRKGLG